MAAAAIAARPMVTIRFFDVAEGGLASGRADFSGFMNTVKASDKRQSSTTSYAAPFAGMLFDYFAVRLNPEKVEGKKYAINVNLTDIHETHGLRVENSVLNHGPKAVAKANANATMTLTKATLDEIQLGGTTLDKAIADGSIKIEGSEATVKDFLASLDTYKFWFNVVTP